ncbi:hypothetical protein F3Y22_tig00010533pilonHSYRG00099 [Hibiscus syriacus]|uniref:Uncharacterized protein n=1 Tax=Hibiscus syriacus TaxID=106335 RepID=A0A6A3C624_HIBSY|nr:hypothetical protein F3Y22_tig00010533pilonHSYRG00099 [Hibiscus syriacus]
MVELAATLKVKIVRACRALGLGPGGFYQSGYRDGAKCEVVFENDDKDESPGSLRKALPVVSFSIGDAAEFLYGDEREVDKAKKVEFEFGDVLESAIKQKTAPGKSFGGSKSSSRSSKSDF